MKYMMNSNPRLRKLFETKDWIRFWLGYTLFNVLTLLGKKISAPLRVEHKSSGFPDFSYLKDLDGELVAQFPATIDPSDAIALITERAAPGKELEVVNVSPSRLYVYYVEDDYRQQHLMVATWRMYFEIGRSGLREKLTVSDIFDAGLQKYHRPVKQEQVPSSKKSGTIVIYDFDDGGYKNVRQQG